MRRPFGFMFALLALWLQALAPAVAARAADSQGFDATAVICDHLGQPNAPQPAAPAPDAHHGACCLAHHMGVANLTPQSFDVVGLKRPGAVIARWIEDDLARGGRSVVDLHARGPPSTL